MSCGSTSSSRILWRLGNFGPLFTDLLAIVIGVIVTGIYIYYRHACEKLYRMFSTDLLVSSF